MDLVGGFIVAFITAFGGGTLRDMLLDRRPLFWVENQEYAILVFVLAVVAWPFFAHLRSAVAKKAIVIADALCLGLFSAGGASGVGRTAADLYLRDDGCDDRCFWWCIA